MFCCCSVRSLDCCSSASYPAPRAMAMGHGSRTANQLSGSQSRHLPQANGARLIPATHCRWTWLLAMGNSEHCREQGRECLPYHRVGYRPLHHHTDRLLPVAAAAKPRRHLSRSWNREHILSSGPGRALRPQIGPSAWLCMKSCRLLRLPHGLRSRRLRLENAASPGEG